MSFALDVGERGGAGWGAKGAEVTGADFWAYALYAPTYLHGPTHQFADFHAQFRRLSQARADKGKRHPDGPPGGWAPPPGSAAEVARMLGTVGAMFVASVSVYMPTVVWYYLRSTALDVGPRPRRRAGLGRGFGGLRLTGSSSSPRAAGGAAELPAVPAVGLRPAVPGLHVPAEPLDLRDLAGERPAERRPGAARHARVLPAVLRVPLPPLELVPQDLARLLPQVHLPAPRRRLARPRPRRRLLRRPPRLQGTEEIDREALPPAPGLRGTDGDARGAHLRQVEWALWGAINLAVLATEKALRAGFRAYREPNAAVRALNQALVMQLQLLIFPPFGYTLSPAGPRGGGWRPQRLDLARTHVPFFQLNLAFALLNNLRLGPALDAAPGWW